MDFLFRPLSEGGIDMSMVRLPISMLSDFVIQEPYTYVDEGDVTLQSFSIEKDLDFFVPLLKEAMLIKKDIKFLAAAWSAPGWMKKENTLFGGEFDEAYVNSDFHTAIDSPWDLFKVRLISSQVRRQLIIFIFTLYCCLVAIYFYKQCH
jgi:hypothetical protein